METLQAFADVLHVNVNRLLEAAGKGGQIGEPLELPAESALLTGSQRLLVEQLVKEFAKANNRTHTGDEESQHDPDIYRLAARRNTSGRFDTDGEGSSISS